MLVSVSRTVRNRLAVARSLLRKSRDLEVFVRELHTSTQTRFACVYDADSR